MDNVEKLRVMLQHWIEHNKGHMADFAKWQQTMSDEGKSSLAAHIAKAVELMAAMNKELDQALHEADGHHHDDHHHHSDHHHHHHHDDTNHHHHHDDDDDHHHHHHRH